MPPKKVIFINIEGIDGTGKGTQSKLLCQKLVSMGYRVHYFDFPMYGSQSSYFVTEYLNGKYGEIPEVGANTASLFYALDRYEAKKNLLQSLEEGDIVISNRFTASNLAHQGANIDGDEARRGFYVWLDNIEHNTLGIPRPDHNFVLTIPLHLAYARVGMKAKRAYTNETHDLHEKNQTHLEKALKNYKELTKIYSSSYSEVPCVSVDLEELGINAVEEKLWTALQQQFELLPLSKKGRLINHAVPKDLSSTTQDKVVEAPKTELSDYITNTDQPVYAFNNKLNPVYAAASMARLSRRMDDLRITLVEEFLNNTQESAETLIKRVITAYGDDSVQQLIGQHLVVEDASQLLTKKLEWGRLGAYLEQSTRYIFFDKKINGKYRYHIPSELSQKDNQIYTDVIDKMFDNYSNAIQILTDYVRNNSSTPVDQRGPAWKSATKAQACDAARAMLPVATTTTVGMYLSGQALESLIMHLRSEKLQEYTKCGDDILRECRKVIGTFLERADLPERGGATSAYMRINRQNISKLAPQGDTKARKLENVKVTNYYPKNELDVIPQMLYESSNLDYESIKKHCDKQKYADKQNIFRTYIGTRLNRRHKPGRAFENISYSLDLICDYGIFRDLQRHRMVSDMAWQLLTPYLGIDTPSLVIEAGLEELFTNNIKLSEQLYELLKINYDAELAQYATLMAHKMRWKMTINARSLIHFIELRTSPQGHPGYRKLCAEIHDKIAEIHPQVAEAMIFLNKAEDPELTRLASELATEHKLDQLRL